MNVLDDTLDEENEDKVELPEWAKPDTCAVAVTESLTALMENCGKNALDIICTIFGVDDEAREKIKSGQCGELTKNGLTECICKSPRAKKAYAACRAIWWVMQGEPIAKAISMAWAEINGCENEGE